MREIFDTRIWIKNFRKIYLIEVLVLESILKKYLTFVSISMNMISINVCHILFLSNKIIDWKIKIY